MVAASINPTPELELVTTYLHMTSRDQFVPAFNPQEGVQMVRMERPDVRYYRFLYGSVGEIWRWRDRLIMPDEQLLSILQSPTNEVHVLQVGNVPAGYIELETRGSESELAYVGLRPEYLGMGLGKHLLSYGIERAWTHDIQRLTVHTCNLDAPAALDNYLKRGFSIWKVEHEPMPERYQ